MGELWPELAYNDWKDTCTTLQLWTQVVGKIRLAFTPWLNHSWHVPLYVSARGLRTSLIHTSPHSFEIEFDFVGQELGIVTSTGTRVTVALQPQTVAEFFGATTQ